MNVASAVVLFVIAVLFAAAVRYIVRSTKDGACSGCDEGCSARGHSGDAGPCPAVRRALDEVDSRLGDNASLSH